MQRMQRGLHIHPVETIGLENVAAWRVLLGGAAGMAAAQPVLVLLHGKVVNIWVVLMVSRAIYIAKYGL